MRLIRFLAVSLLTGFLLAGCAREDKPTLNKAVWSSRDPFNIPYKKRINEYREGNRVTNPSFEKGKFFNTNLDAIKINGWKEVGEDVTWVNTAKPGFNSSEVKSGTHSIKISRDHVSEVEDDGIGVMSDYMKVFPGNYSLSYAIRLKNICSNRERLGSRLMDAINVRILYYDKNKIRIEGDAGIPGGNNVFDNEFKALPFSGFWNIDSLGWINARGISHKFPFSDGDIPDNTRYVRLFFGLKGSGTMWVDDVNFSFSRKNFTLLERLKRWEDDTFDRTDLLIPTPKKIEAESKIALYNPQDLARQPLIVVPEKSDELTLKAAHTLKQKMLAIAGELLPNTQLSIPIVHSASLQYLNGRSLVFSIGKNSINRKYTDLLPFKPIEGKSQGYFIQRLNDTSNIIAVSGNTPIGNYYAITTISQLLCKKEFTYHHANMIDYPDYLQRGIICCTDTSGSSLMTDFYARNRFNNLFLNVTDVSAQKTGQAIRLLGKQSMKGSLYQPGISLNPYKYDNIQKPGDLLSDDMYKKLRTLVSTSANNSFSNILVRVDDTFYPKDSCSCLFEPDFQGEYAHYKNLIDVHSQLINSIYSWLEKDSRMVFLPAWHHNRCIIRSHGRGEIFLKELSRKIPHEVDILWTGPSVQPLVVDEVETTYIEKLYGKQPVFFTNIVNPLSNREFLIHYPGKARMGSIFEHFNLDLPGHFCDLTNYQFISKLVSESVTNTIKMMTLAEYLWNSRDSNPDFTLLKILISKYGKQPAFELCRFNEAYLGLFEMYGKIKTKETKRKYIRSAEDFHSQLTRIMNTLRVELKDRPILQELEAYREKADHYYTSILSK